ncbi:CPBP family glutamic-type intramembrane protease [Thermococcus aciditolerans]|uniref:CPBP family intramembrane metalloprotease n=1 Tax=Thermococcus aciditolerans TaxID=2598455 RepID=A0A5C0SLT5_9EURY|nr:CPBP family glutamic-type intramembrane protease [Thermococcus aciditolerans]QEK15385.1 CPBP family intramembrane metalloprotease [Thermococcus aciditolerans]
MQTALQMALGAFGTILFVLLAHKKIGSYPSPLPKSENPTRELLEAVTIWLIVFASITYIVLFGAESYPSVEIGGIKFSLHFFLVLLLPFVVEVVIHRRDARELGFRAPVAWKPAIALVGFGIFFGFFAFLFEGHVSISTEALIIGLLSPSFKEEWFYRATLQSKLERAMGQNRAWLLAGLLFALAHIPTTFFGPLWEASGHSISAAIFRFIGHCTFGWLWGILYMKSRSVFPATLGHYFADFLPALL